MVNPAIAFQTIDWKTIARTEHKGETSTAYWQTIEFDGLRIRYVEYSKNYKADHWCQKGHIVYCLKGEVVNELEDGSRSILHEGMSYVVYGKHVGLFSIDTLEMIEGDLPNTAKNWLLNGLRLTKMK